MYNISLAFRRLFNNTSYYLLAQYWDLKNNYYLTRVFINVHQFAIEKRQWYPRPPFRGPRGCQSPLPGSHRIGTGPTISANPDDHNMPASVYVVECAKQTHLSLLLTVKKS